MKDGLFRPQQKTEQVKMADAKELRDNIASLKVEILQIEFQQFIS
jgi:hypothetical protein